MQHEALLERCSSQRGFKRKPYRITELGCPEASFTICPIPPVYVNSFERHACIIIGSFADGWVRKIKNTSDTEIASLLVSL